MSVGHSLGNSKWIRVKCSTLLTPNHLTSQNLYWSLVELHTKRKNRPTKRLKGKNQRWHSTFTFPLSDCGRTPINTPGTTGTTDTGGHRPNHTDTRGATGTTDTDGHPPPLHRHRLTGAPRGPTPAYTPSATTDSRLALGSEMFTPFTPPVPNSWNQVLCVDRFHAIHVHGKIWEILITE